MEVTEIIRCRGHHHVSASHPTTFEVTTEQDLTRNGHCIIAVEADKGAAALSAEFRNVLCHDDAILETTLIYGGCTVHVRSAGSKAMTLDHPSDLVWRRSTFVCGRTVGIRSDMVAASLPKELVRHLREGRDLVVRMTAMRPG